LHSVEIFKKNPQTHVERFDGNKVYSEELGYCEVVATEDNGKLLKVKELALKEEDRQEVTLESQKTQKLTILVKVVYQDNPYAQSFVSEFRIRVTDTVSSLKKAIDLTLEDNCILIYKGIMLEEDKHFWEYKMNHNDKMLAVCGRLEEGSGSSTLQFYSRFPRVKDNDYHYTGRGSSYWDAICFVPKKNIKVFGVAIYKIYNREDRFSYGIRYKIQDKDGNDVVPTKEWEGSHDDRSAHEDFRFPIMFKERGIADEPLIVKKGWKFHVASW
jgi:hypothetical protein